MYNRPKRTKFFLHVVSSASIIFYTGIERLSPIAGTLLYTRGEAL